MQRKLDVLWFVAIISIHVSQEPQVLQSGRLNPITSDIISESLSVTGTLRTCFHLPSAWEMPSTTQSGKWGLKEEEVMPEGGYEGNASFGRAAS